MTDDPDSTLPAEPDDGDQEQGFVVGEIVDPEQLEGIIRQISREEFHAGPLPDPSTVERYEGVHPGSFDRILKMAEATLAHEIDREKREMDERKQILDYNDRALEVGQSHASIGMWLGFGLVLALFILAGYIASLGNTGAAAWLAAGAAGLASVFVLRESKRRSEDLGPESEAEDEQ